MKKRRRDDTISSAIQFFILGFYIGDILPGGDLYTVMEWIRVV